MNIELSQNEQFWANLSDWINRGFKVLGTIAGPFILKASHGTAPIVPVILAGAGLGFVCGTVIGAMIAMFTDPRSTPPH